MALVNTETVRGEYSSGTGFEPGNRAPSTLWTDENGKVVDSEPKGVGRVLVAAGDVVHPHIADAIKAGSRAVAGARLDNEHSFGDASHAGREPLEDDDDSDGDGDGDTPPAPDYSKMNKGPLQDEIDARNAPRPDDAKIDREGTKAELAARLKADDAARAGDDDA